MDRAALLFMVMCAVIFLAPLASPHDPLATDPDRSLQPPAGAHLLGTDRLGRDVLSRALHGGQRTLLMALLATLVAACLGLFLGLTAGLVGGALDTLVSAILTAMLALPGLLLALVVMTLLGPGPVAVAIAAGTSLIAQYARVARAAISVTLQHDYVQAARSLGATERSLLLAHVVPNALPSLVAITSVTFAYSLLNTAALSFLGLAGDLGVPDWGSMLFEARVTFRSAPWIGLVPGLGITVVVWTANRLADHISRGASRR